MMPLLNYRVVEAMPRVVVRGLLYVDMRPLALKRRLIRDKRCRFLMLMMIDRYEPAPR